MSVKSEKPGMTGGALGKTVGGALVVFSVLRNSSTGFKIIDNIRWKHRFGIILRNRTKNSSKYEIYATKGGTKLHRTME